MVSGGQASARVSAGGTDLFGVLLFLIVDLDDDVLQNLPVLKAGTRR